jgi:outer membrane receptor for ferrienterochelin and colicin
MLKGRASMPISTVGSSVALEVNAFSERQTVIGTMLDGAVTTNLTVSQPLTPSLTLYGTVKNLFDVEFADPVADYYVQSEVAQDGRTWHVGLRWRLGGE